MKNYCYTCMEEIREGNFCMTCMKDNEPSRYMHHIKPGTILNGKYLVGNCIGEGGFGITYIGRDLTLDIKVAVKEYFPNGYVNRTNDVTQMVTTTTETQSEFFARGKERFLQEARNVARFSDEPGIVNVREYFEENNTAYIVMGYLDGQDLSSYFKEHGPFEAKELFRLMLPVADSLQKIHETGIIHRDISPDNMMYRTNGTLTLTDFGSARYFTNEEKEMSVVLKQGYAPEEQYRRNGEQGPWTDVYGLCATIYRCITGKVPEDALDRMRADTLKKPSELGVEISEPLEKVLMHGLEVFRENRFQSMRELSDSIRKALNRQQVTLKKGRDVREEIFRTQAADDHRTQAANEPIPKQADETKSGAKLCPRCKTPAQPSDRYCTNCAYDFYGKAPRGNTLLYVILSIMALLLGVLVFTVVSTRSTSSGSEAEVSASVETAVPEPTPTPAPTPQPTPTPTPWSLPAGTTVEDRVLWIRAKYNEIMTGIANDIYTTVTGNAGETLYYSGSELKCVMAPKGTDGSDYGRMYYYDSGELIFAYYEAQDGNRLYFYDGRMIRWRYCTDKDDYENSINHDLENSSAYLDWEREALQSGRRYLY